MNYHLPNQKHLRLLKNRLLLPVILALAFVPRLHAQAYIEHSRVIGESGTSFVHDLVVDASGSSYIVGTVSGSDYPVTMGAVPPTSAAKPVLIKLDPSGNRVWARYLPFSPTGTGSCSYGRMLLYNGTLYMIGVSSGSSDIPVTDGSVWGGGTSDLIFTKVDAASGAVLHHGYIGGSGNEGTLYDMAMENGNVYITYSTNSPNIPVTTGPAYTTGYDQVVLKLDASGNIVYNTYVGSLSSAVPGNGGLGFATQNGMAYIAVVVTPTNNFITTDGSAWAGGNDIGVVRLDASGNRNLATIIGGSTAEGHLKLFVNNGDIYLSGVTASTNYPATDGSSKIGLNSIVLTKFNSNGNIVFSGYKASSNLGGGFGTAFGWANGALYFAAVAPLSTFGIQTTDGSNGGGVLMRIDPATGTTQFVTKFGPVRNGALISYIEMIIADGIFIASSLNTSASETAAAFTTDGSTWNVGRSGTFVTKHALDGQLLFASYLRTPNSVISGSYQMAANNGKMYLSGTTQSSTNFPVTHAPLGTSAGTDATWTAYSFCPPMPTDNAISPLSQSICQNGFAQTLTGNDVAYTSSQMPTLYISGAPQQQNEIRARYQWQVAASVSGPWTNIAAGTQRDYTPTPGAQSFYYRRLVLPPSGCGDIPVSISATAEVVVGANAAPTVTGGVFNTCVNTAVNISATVTGGAAPFTYAWDNGIGSTTNTATVTPTTNSVYTLTVIDNNGCQQVGQAIVNAYAADAGPAAMSSCAGNPVRIGAAPPAGLSGVTYSWTPTTGLDDPTAAQPLATPGVTTVYTLQMTIPVSGGGTCTTSDNITVNVVAGPTTPNFAGADQATCKGGNLSLGTTAEAGFTYTWSPGSYLSGANASTTTFSPGTNLPQPNPFVYTLTASRNGCSFTDQVTVAVLDVDAGEDYCGPRTVGTGDKMPGVTGKTWLWEVVSGPGTITGSTNTPTTTVSAAASLTTYRVTVSYLGANCSDEVVVGPCGSGGCPDVDIDTLANHGCPSTVFGTVSLRAKPFNLDPSQWSYTWSSVPAGGLSATTGHTITLTDNVERDVTVTVSRIDNPGVSCSETIHVNDPSWSLPVFNVPDQTICPASNIGIGTAPVAGYGYTWKGVSVPEINSSNPIVSPSETTNYPVIVTETISGCELHDTVKVTVKPLIVNPGPDWLVCNNAVIQLGSPAQPGYTYSWDPQVAAYQNGTTYQSAEPQVLIATTQDFTLTVTDTETGCTADSIISITVDGGSNLPAMTDTTICAGSSATIGLPAWGGVTYNWSPATGLSSTTVAQPTASPAATTVYTLTVTYYDAGGAPVCTKTGTVTVTVASPQITMSDESICPSGTLYNLSNGVTVTGATTYLWTPELLVTSPDALSTTAKNNPGTPTTFTLTATDANGCSTSASKVVSPLNPAPEAGSQGYVCVGDSRTIGSSSNTGVLSWSISPAITGTLSPANGAQPVFTPAAGDAGKTFTFVITQDIGGCINTDSVKMLVRSLALPVMPAQTVCMNAPATIGIAAAPNVSYAWTPVTGLTDPNAATTTVSSVTSNAIYTLIATDIYGCTASGTATVGVNPVQIPSVTIPDVTVQLGSPGIPFSPQISPMPASYAYTWTPPSGVNNPYISNATAIPGDLGTYTYDLTVTDGNGCTTVAPARLIVTMSTLPVTLSSFSGSVKNCGVQLDWKVLTADNFSHFVIERNNGRGFQSIGRVNYEAYKEVYRFADSDPGNGNWTYRLRLMDLDGRSAYSTMVLAKVNCSSNETLVVYPNPLSDKLYINSSKPVRKVSVFSIDGQLLMQREYGQVQAGVIQMPVDNQMPQGLYVLQVMGADGTIQSTKLIKR